MKTLLSLITFFSIVNLYAQWQPDVRLTYDGAQSYMSNPNKHCIASSGNVLHVVWHDQRSNWDIYYKRSTDAGLSWGADTRLSNGSGESHEAGVAVSGSVVHVVWHDNRDGHWEIYYIRSTDGGISWGAENRISTLDAFNSNTAGLSISGSVVHVVWMDERDGNWEIYYKHSTDGGTSWGTDLRLTNNSAVSQYPCISASGSILSVVWYDDRDGNWEVYYKRTTDAGTTWGAEARLSDIPYISASTSVSAYGSTVHVFWRDERIGNSEIYYKRSTNAGLNWTADTRLTNNPGYSEAPNSTISGSNVHLTWQDDRDGNHEIYYKRSTDEGLNWGADTRLSNAGGTSVRSFSTVTGTAVHVVWMDERAGNWEIYYKQDPTGNPVPLPPPAPNLVSPPNWSTIYTTTPLLDWDSLPSINYYRVQIATDSVFTFILYDTVGVINSSCYVPNGELSSGSTYFWRVRATNTAGNGPWSIIWRFFIAPGPPAPNLVSPLNGSYNQLSTVRFIWNKSVSALTYRLQVALDSQFTNLVFNDSTLTDSTIVIANLTVNKYYWWRVSAKNTIGTSPYSAVWKFGTFFVGLKEIGSEIPKEFMLHSNHPNPFNPVTKIRYDIAKSAYTRLIVYDILGEEVAVLVNEKLNPGVYETEFDGSNYPSGIYFYKLETEYYVETKKMVLLK